MNFDAEIEELKKTHQCRALKICEFSEGPWISWKGKKLLNLGSNDYLGMSQHPEVIKAFVRGIEMWGTGSGASRLVSGTKSAHHDLEVALAAFSAQEASLVFPSGYMANLGLISALAKKNDWVILDKLDHASLVDGAKLSGAVLRVFPHLDYDALERLLQKAPSGNKKIIVTDTIFSMDGDAADLKRLGSLKEKYGAILIADEAHAVGVFGQNGGGLALEQGVMGSVDFKMGTLSKAFGLQGGYIAASHSAIAFLVNRCRPFLYTTGILPGICVAALKVIELFRGMQKEREHLKSLASWVRESLRERGINTLNSLSQIIPIIVGDNVKVLELEKRLYENGFFVPAIRSPTVKKGSERLRLSLTVGMTRENLTGIFHNIL
jgi:8-amino-7-oxononanoate synthase